MIRATRADGPAPERPDARSVDAANGLENGSRPCGRALRFCSWVRRLVHCGFGFRLFFLGFRRGIPRAFLLSQLFPCFRGGFGNPGLQFLGIDLLRTRTKEAPLVNGHRVLQVAANVFQLLDLSLKGLLFGLPRLRLGLPRLDLLAQAPVLLRQPFLWGRAHRHNLWRAWPLRG